MICVYCDNSQDLNLIQKGKVGRLFKMGCRGICGKYKALKPANGSRYENGQKRCQTCEVFLKWNGNQCPCCKLKLRLGSRYIKLKENAVNIDRI